MTTLTDRCDEAMARAIFGCDYYGDVPEYPADRRLDDWLSQSADTRDQYHDVARAARLALLSELDAEGWHVVPSHPDRQMQTAGSSAIIKAIELARRENGGDIEETLHCNDVYKPMIAAAPHPFQEDKP